MKVGDTIYFTCQNYDDGGCIVQTKVKKMLNENTVVTEDNLLLNINSVYTDKDEAFRASEISYHWVTQFVYYKERTE